MSEPEMDLPPPLPPSKVRAVVSAGGREAEEAGRLPSVSFPSCVFARASGCRASPFLKPCSPDFVRWRPLPCGAGTACDSGRLSCSPSSRSSSCCVLSQWDESVCRKGAESKVSVLGKALLSAPSLVCRKVNSKKQTLPFVSTCPQMEHWLSLEPPTGLHGPIRWRLESTRLSQGRGCGPHFRGGGGPARETHCSGSHRANGRGPSSQHRAVLPGPHLRVQSQDPNFCILKCGFSAHMDKF